MRRILILTMFSGENERDMCERALHRQSYHNWEHIWFEGLPNVEANGGSALLPMTGYYAWTDFVVEGYNATSEKDRVVADDQMVTPGYLEAMGIPLLAPTAVF